MNLRRLTPPDLAIGAAVLLLIAAVLWPTLTARSYRNLADTATTEVDLLQAAGLDVRRNSGRWPDAASAGEVPTALRAAYSGRNGFSFDDFTMEWTQLDVIEYVEASPEAFSSIPDDEEPDSSVPPSGAIGDLPPDSVGPLMAPAVRQIGAIVVRTGNESLLADLLTRYGPTVSYVRDTTWTLIVDDRSGSTP